MQHILEFDGGTSCNIPSKGYGIGYGSFKINGLPVAKRTYGNISANTAEVLTMAEGLMEIYRIFGKSNVLVRGDSQIALNWVNKLSGCSHAGSVKISKKASLDYIEAVFTLRSCIMRHNQVKSEWRGRAYSVQLFGH